MRYSWEIEYRGDEFGNVYVERVIRDGRENIGTADTARDAESIVEALNAWDRARADVKKMLEPARQ